MGTRYTEREDQVIRDKYPEHGISWDGWDIYLPGRDRKAIGARAAKLGVRCLKKRAWTFEEDEALRANYGVRQRNWAGWRSVLPGRTWSAILNRAGTLGLTAACRWTDEDRKTLMRHIITAARETGHTPHGCVRQLYQLDRYVKGGRMPVIEGGVVRFAEDSEAEKAS